MEEAEIRTHPSQVRETDTGGRCLASKHMLGSLPRLLAARLAARLVLMTSGCRLLSSVASTTLAAVAAATTEETAMTTDDSSSSWSMVAIRLDFWPWRDHRLSALATKFLTSW